MALESQQIDEYLNSAQQSLQFGIDELALRWFEQAIALNSESIEAWSGKAEALRKLGRYGEAIEANEKAIAFQMNFVSLDAEFWLEFEKGFNRYQAGDVEGAIISWDRTLQSNPKFYPALLNRSTALIDLGCYEEAIANCDQILQSNPELYAAWFNRGIALGSLGRYEEEIASYNKVLRYNPNDYKALLNRGVALSNLEQHEGAIASYGEILQSKPNDELALFNRSCEFKRLGRLEEEIASHDEILRYKPEFARAWINRSRALMKLGRLEEAIFNCNQGLIYVLKEVDPEGWGRLHFAKGTIYLDQARNNQNVQTARAHCSQALTLYNTATQVLETFPESYLKLIGTLIQAHLGLDNSETANQWRITGLEVFRRLLNAQPTPFLKRKLEAEFSGFSRVAIDTLIEGETSLALETAERYKNRCLTWILDEWKETIISPSYAEMRQLLNSQTAIVYWHFSDDSLTTFILTPDSEDPILLNTLQYDRAQKLQSWIKTWNTQYNDYRTKKNNQFAHPWRKALTAQLAKLREILDIDAIVQSLGTLDRLILIPHRDLHRLPLHSLFPNFTTVYLPSIQIGLNLQHKPRSTHPPKLLSVEDPKTDRPQMPYAQLESALTCHFFPDHTRIDDTEATTEKVTQALSDRHTHFHFTGHAGYDMPPENSALILANDDRLTAKTIRHLDLSHYELITLSACETALTGNQTIDTEFVGLVSAFLQAGATAVLSTLWNVHEISSTWLILKFYELQTPPAEALKTAQLWLQSLTYEALLQWFDRTLAELPSNHRYRQDIQDEITLIQKNLTEHKIELHQTPYSDPYHWAAFTLTGGTL